MAWVAEWTSCVVEWTADANIQFIGSGDWWYNATSICDANHTFYLKQHGYAVADGSFLWSVTNRNFADAIDAFHGSPIVNRRRGEGFFGRGALWVTPILGGQYLIAYMRASSDQVATFDRWFGILAPPVAVNQINLLGVVRYRTLLGVPYTDLTSILVMGGQSAGDPTPLSAPLLMPRRFCHRSRTSSAASTTTAACRRRRGGQSLITLI